MSDTAKAGFCRQCGQNVWLTPEGVGTCGHPSSEIENAYETPIPNAEPEPVVVPVVVPAPEPVYASVAAPMPVATAPQLAPPGGPKKSPLKWILAAVAVLVVIALVVVFFPRARFEVSSFEVPESVMSGEDAVVAVDIENKGWFGGEYDLIVLVDGEPAESTTVKLGGGAKELIEIPLTDIAPGKYELTLADWKDLGGTLWVKTDADFKVDSVVVTPNPMDIAKGSKATVLVSASNAGETDGDYTLSLTLDGKDIAERDVFIEGDSGVQETFDITVPGPGDSVLAVNGFTVDLPIYKIERPGNGKVFVNKLTGGSNQMKIINNFADDYLVVLTAPGEGKPVLLSVYVMSKSSTTVKGIKSGTYSVYYAYGAYWDTAGKKFTDRVGYGLFETDSKYTSSSSQYTIFTYTFGATGGAGVPTEDVTEDGFPKF